MFQLRPHLLPVVKYFHLSRDISIHCFEISLDYKIFSLQFFILFYAVNFYNIPDIAYCTTLHFLIKSASYLHRRIGNNISKENFSPDGKLLIILLI